MATLADILVTLTLETNEFNQKLNEVSRRIESLTRSVSNSTRDINDSLNNVSGDNLSEDITRNTDEITRRLNRGSQDISNSMRDISRTSRRLARTMGTDSASMQRVLQSATAEYDLFGSHSRRISREVKEQFGALPSHLQRYVQRLQEAGQSTAEFARLNQQYSSRIIENMRRSNDYLQNKTSQSMRLLQSMARDTNLAPLTGQFLRLGDSMERTARLGTPLNIALGRLGENASLRDLQNEMRLVSQGIARARGAFIGFGISAGIVLAGMIYIASVVDSRVKPAFEGLKSSALDAFMPWIKAVATSIVAVLEFVTGITDLIGKFSEAHPLIFKMIGAFLLLTLVLGALLAPLAVTGIWAEGVAASFAALWAIISPFVLGMLAVVGVAMAVAGALVILWVSIKELWKNSEAFRQAWINIWNQVKEMVVNNLVAPVLQAWNNLKSAFTNLIATITGGSGTMGNMWTWLGDHLAVIVTNIASVVLPLLQGAFKILGIVISAVINGVVAIVNWMAEMWSIHGDKIMSVAQAIWSKVMEAFTGISTYIQSIMPQIVAVLSDGWNLVMAIIDFVMKYIAPVVVGAFKIIWQVISFLMPTILSIIVGTWNNIKSVITSSIAIIQNVIQLFTNILKGNWSGAWNNVKAILSNALTLIWNLVQLYFLGKLLAPLRGFATAGKGLVTSAWTGFLNIIRSILNNTKAFIVGIWNAIKSSLSGSFTGIVNLGRSSFNTLKSTITSIFQSIKSTATAVWNAVKTAITSPIESAKNTVLKIISTIVKAFASMKISIPNIKLPHINVGSKSFLDGKVKIPTFNVSWHAKGGIFNSATLLGGGQHGVGEAGNEAVMPIQHKRYMQPFASAIASNLNSGGGTNSTDNQYIMQFNEPIIVREEADIHRISRELFDLIDKRTRGRGVR